MTPFLECLWVGCLIYVFAPFLYYSFNDVMSMPARRDGIRGDKGGAFCGKMEKGLIKGDSCWERRDGVCIVYLPL